MYRSVVREVLYIIPLLGESSLMNRSAKWIHGNRRYLSWRGYIPTVAFRVHTLSQSCVHAKVAYIATPCSYVLDLSCTMHRIL